MTNNRTILITGVTGKQGGSVAQALQGAGFHLRGLTRKPESERAALARQGIDIVKGDLDDEATLRRALAGVEHRPNIATAYSLQDVAQAWKDIAGNLPGVHGMSPNGPGATKRGSLGKIVLRVA